VIGSYLSSPRKLQVISCWRFPGCPRCYAPERSFNHTNLPGHRRSPSYHHQAPISISAIQVAPRSGGKPSRDRPYICTLGHSQADLRCRLWQRMRVEIVLRRHDERTSNSRLLSPKKRKESAIGVPPPSTGQDWQTFPGGSAHLHWLLPSYSAQKKSNAQLGSTKGLARQHLARSHCPPLTPPAARAIVMVHDRTRYTFRAQQDRNGIRCAEGFPPH
jgi:hypothetical protein